MLIRPAGPDDVDAVVALVAEVDRERGEEFDEKALRDFLGRAVLFVAELNGRIVGNLGLHPADHGSAAIGMSVDAVWRRRGLGTALIEAAIEWARAEGVERLTLEVLADNAPARALYDATGFVETGRRQGVILMSRLVKDRTQG